VATFFELLPPRRRDRVDIFDQTGQLVEYATVDAEARRVEFYSSASRLIGQGTLDPASGRVERRSLEGSHPELLFLPIPPRANGGG
jgi:hypothetical protein